MIQLSLRSAASLPILGAFVIGIAYAARSSGSWDPALELKLRLIQFGIPAFFAAMMGLIFVIPNVLAALAANRFGASSMLSFAIVFMVVCALTYELQSRMLSHGWLAKSGLSSSGGDPWVIGTFLANVASCVLLAAFMSWRR